MEHPTVTVMRPLLSLLAAAALAGCASAVTWDPEPPPAAVAAEPIPERPVGPSDHLVRSGDTVYSIAFRNQLDYRQLARWNGIGPGYVIRPGQVLRLTEPPMQRTGDIASQAVDLDVAGAPRAIGSSAPPPTVTSEPAIVAGGRSGWTWPTDGVVMRGYDTASGSKGLDFTGEVGQPVRAAAAGKVVYSGNALKGYGELVIIKHDDLRLSAYGHNATRMVNEGDTVTAGQQIAAMGMGPENKPMLHFEIRERGVPVNPVPFLPAKQASGD